MNLFRINSLALLAPFLVLCSAPASAEEDSFVDILTAGNTQLTLRYRFEFVDQDGFAENANASTLRTRLNYRTGRWNNFSVFLEAENVSHIIWDDFNSGAGTSPPGKSIYPVVADPSGTEFNQAYLDYNFSDDSNLRFGRQRILLDNQRFVGGVGWRQNEQTYDAFSYISQFSNNAKLFVSYVWNVNRIFGDSVAAGDHKQDTVLANLAIPIKGFGELVGYWYNIDNQDAVAFSTTTLGLKWSGKVGNEDSMLSYGLEFASQSAATNNPVNYSANYYRLDAAFAFKPLTLLLGFESLGGDANNTGAAFRTPLATLHAFNGWADKFLATPDAGLNDFFFGAKGKLGKNKWAVIYHNYSAADGNGNFGSEVNANFAIPIDKNFSVLLKAAVFNGDDGYPDTTKLWAMVSAKF